MDPKTKSCIMIRRRGCRKLKMEGQGTGCSTWLYDFSRYVEAGHGDVVVVDATSADDARLLAKALLDGRIRPNIVVGYEGVPTRLIVHGKLSRRCFVGAQISIQTWDRVLGAKGKVPMSHTKPMAVYEKAVTALQKLATRNIKVVVNDGGDAVN